MTLKPSQNDFGGSNMELQRTRDLIIALKQAKNEKAKFGLTLPRLEAEILRRGKSVSMSSLKRVFREGSEDSPAGFSLDHTLLPIAEVLLDDDTSPVADACAPLETDRLRAELQIQIERVESLLAQNDILLDRVKFMQTQIERKDRRLDEKDEVLRKVMEERDKLRARLEASDGDVL